LLLFIKREQTNIVNKILRWIAQELITAKILSFYKNKIATISLTEHKQNSNIFCLQTSNTTHSGQKNFGNF